MYQVTYLNKAINKTCVMQGCLTEEQANAVVAKFGDPRQPRYYMGPEVKAEPIKTEEVAA